MSDNNTPLTHMTDSVTPTSDPVTHSDRMTNAQEQIAKIYDATLKAMVALDEVKYDLKPETDLRKLVGHVWSRAMEYAQDYIDDNLNREVEIAVRIDEECSGYDVTARITGSVEQSVIPTEVGIDFDIPTIPNANDLDEILEEYEAKERDRKLQAASATAHEINASINLSKNNDDVYV
jgi:hypothetical protein